MSHFQLYFVSLQRIREIHGPADWPHVEGAGHSIRCLKSITQHNTTLAALSEGVCAP